MAPLTWKTTKTTRSTRTTRTVSQKTIYCTSVIVGLVGIVVIVGTPQAQAWGSITHVAICREVSANAEFQAGGHCPDMIALNSVVTGDNEYDYAHNLAGGGRSFGTMMADIAGPFGRGWSAHQLADSIVHGSGGYSETKTVFSGLPARYGIGLGHGATELIVDAIVLEDIFGGHLDFTVPDKSVCIHETSIRYFNASAGAIPRRNIISCHDVEGMAAAWEGWLDTNLYLAKMMTDEPWFLKTRADYADYREHYSESVRLIASGTTTPGERRLHARRGLLDGLIRFIMPAPYAKAAEGSKEGKSAYMSLVMRLSERAKEIGGGRVTEESVEKALREMETARGLTREERIWAKTLKEMTCQGSQDFSSVEREVVAFGRGSGPARGASGGRFGRGFLPYLPFAILVSLGAAGLAGLYRSIRGRR